MKKLSILTLARNEERTLDTLGRLGLLHIGTPARRPSEVVARLREEISILDAAMNLCEPGSSGQAAGLSETEILSSARRLLDMDRIIGEDRSRLRELEEARRSLPDFLKVDPVKLQTLARKGIHLTLRRALIEDLGRIPTGLAYGVLEAGEREVTLAFFTREEEIPTGFAEIPVPTRSPQEMDSLIDGARRELSAHLSELEQLRSTSGSFRAQRALCADRLIFEQTRASLGRAGPVSILIGYCPAEHVSEVDQEALKSGWALLVEDPGPDDPVPTVLRPSRMGRFFMPIMRLLSVLPGYRESDPAGVLTPFFALFTAMLVNDAGYGVVIFLMAILLRKRLIRVGRDAYSLLLILGGATMVWGALHGAWFGLDALADLPVLRFLALDAFQGSEWNTGDSAIRLCLLIGTVHLSAARLMSVIRTFPSSRAIGEGGWILFLCGMYGLGNSLLLGEPLPHSALLFLGGGLATALIFPGGRPGRGFALSDYGHQVPLALLIGLGSLSDIVSYLRLFAVGMASQVLSAAFNGLAADTASGGTLWGWAFAGMIFVLGHSSNMLLSAMAILVHGVRLNLLEFSRHSGSEWGGIAYTPFAFKSRRTWEGVEP